MITLESVLVATDFSEPSDVALSYGRNLARTFGATLHILHVAESVMATAGVEYLAESIESAQAAIEKSAWRQLDALLSVDDTLQLRAQKEVRTSSSSPAIPSSTRAVRRTSRTIRARARTATSCRSS